MQRVTVTVISLKIWWQNFTSFHLPLYKTTEQIKQFQQYGIFPEKTGQCLNLHLHKAHQGTAPCCPICWGKKTLNKAGQLPAAQHWTALTGNWVWGTGTETGHDAPAQPLQPSCPFQQDQEQKSKHRARRVMATDPVKSCCVWCRSLGFPLNIPVGTI